MQAVETKRSNVKFNLNLFQDLKFAVIPQSSDYINFPYKVNVHMHPCSFGHLEGNDAINL